MKPTFTHVSGTVVSFTKEIVEQVDIESVKNEIAQLQSGITQANNMIEESTKRKLELQAQIDDRQALIDSIVAQVPSVLEVAKPLPVEEIKP